MSKLVVDASVAIKWIISEDGSTDALEFRKYALVAPDLLFAECANILWKKVRRKLISPAQAGIGVRAFCALDIEIISSRVLLERATQLAIEIDHPAYDCMYLAAAIERDCRLVTADKNFRRSLSQKPYHERLIVLGS